MGRKFLTSLAIGVSLLSFNSTIQAYPKYFGYGEPSPQVIQITKDHINMVHACGENEEEVMALLRLAKQYNLKAGVVIGSILFRESGEYIKHILTNEKIAKWNAFIERLRREGYLIAGNPEGSTVVTFYIDEPDTQGIADIDNKANPEVAKLVNLIKGNGYTHNFPISAAVSRLYKLGPGESSSNGTCFGEKNQVPGTNTYNCKFTEGIKQFDWIGITAYKSDDQTYLRDLDEMEINYPDKKKILVPKAVISSEEGDEQYVQHPDVFYPHVVNNPNVIGIIPFLWQGESALESDRLAKERNDYIRMGYEISYKPQIVSQSIPSTMVVGELYNVSINLKNEGSKTWLKNKVRLGTKNPDNNTIWGTNRLDLPYDVAPGQTVTVQVVLGTPSSESGVYPIQVQLIVDEQYWIGSPSQLVNVTVKKPDAAHYESIYKPKFVSQSIPSTMVVGKLYNVSVTFKNEGTKTWLKGKVRLGTKNPDNNTIWGTNRLDLPYDVAPGQTVTVQTVVGTPSSVRGTYPLQVQLIVDEQYWIGSPSQLVNVVVQTQGDEYQTMYNPTYVGQSIPTYMRIGQLHNISMTFKNNGTQTWPKGKVRLGTKSPDNNTIWGTNRLDLPYNVAPGQQVTIYATVGTPHSTPGTYPLQVQLIVDEQYWIGNLSPLTYVTTGY